MLPILLVHGYSSEGNDGTARDIYGGLPASLKAEFGDEAVVEIDLSRWISLSDGITLDDVSFAMHRALSSNRFKSLLSDGFHVVVHSTGALVVRNWIRLFSPKPCPIGNLVHLAGAQFGSGLAHVGKGQLARWGRLVLQGAGRGVRVLNELEFGASKTLDLHQHFLRPGNDMLRDYAVQEFCLAGSQTLGALRLVPIRYVKEDSADNTVRTSAANLNYTSVVITPTVEALRATRRQVTHLYNDRVGDNRVAADWYDVTQQERSDVPFAVLYETAHFGEEIGIVDGAKNRNRVIPEIGRALRTAANPQAYAQTAVAFAANHNRTFARVARLRGSVLDSLLDWDKHAQYEGHAQLIFRLRDQFGNDVSHHDITFKSRRGRGKRIEQMIEDKHINQLNPGTVTFYLRTQEFSDGQWQDLLAAAPAVDIEITGHESDSDEITFVPLTIDLSRARLKRFLRTFQTTVIDVTLARLPSQRVFQVTRA